MRRVAPVLGMALVCTACNPVATIRELLGLQEQEAAPNAEVHSAVTSEAKPTGNLAKENQELLAEMIRVIFAREDAEDQSDFEGLVQSLNQGASLEGIYRGIIMGSRYRGLESTSQGAGPTVLKAFANEMALLQESMRNPTRFDPEWARQAPRIDYPEEVTPGSKPAEVSPSPEAQPSPPGKMDRNDRFQELLRIFVGASPYTLKRILGEEALKKFDESKDDPTAIPLWYGEFAVRMARLNFDLGLDLRRKDDFEFHKRFASKMALDRVKWEVLNRVHRYLNVIKAAP